MSKSEARVAMALRHRAQKSGLEGNSGAQGVRPGSISSNGATTMKGVSMYHMEELKTKHLGLSAPNSL